MFTLILFLLITYEISTLNVSLVNDLYVTDYLIKYGYLQLESNELSDLNNFTIITEAINLFQEYYNLDYDDEYNIKKIMLKPRCGVPDVNDYRIANVKWNTNILRWNFLFGNKILINIAKKAFNVWQKHTNLTFIFSKTRYNILILMSGPSHICHESKVKCAFSNNDKSVLGHSYFPNKNQDVVEIHMNKEIDWDFSTKENNFSHPSFLITLAHEIGHALGIEHTHEYYNTSLMYPIYNYNRNVFELSNDDVYAIQRLYGKEVTTTMNVITFAQEVTEKATYKTTISVSFGKSNKDNYPDLCEITNYHLLIIEESLYLLHDKWIWYKHLNDEVYSDVPVQINKWLKFLPDNFTGISGVYRSINGNINLVIDKSVYTFSYPDLELLSITTDAHVSEQLKIMGVVSTYTGKIVYFYTNNFYIEYCECVNYRKSLRFGSFHDYPQIPNTFSSVFRFINGMLYFFDDHSYYEYNEFTKILTKVGKKDLSMFGFKCVSKNTLNKLKEIIDYFVRYKNNFMN